MKVTQLCLTLGNPVEYTVLGILQAIILEWAAIPFSRESSQPRDWIQVSCMAGEFLPTEPPGKPKNTGVGSLSLLQRIFLTQESDWGLLRCRQFFFFFFFLFVCFFFNQLSYQGNPCPWSGANSVHSSIYPSMSMKCSLCWGNAENVLAGKIDMTPDVMERLIL